jgi:hypothetical protein
MALVNGGGCNLKGQIRRELVASVVSWKVMLPGPYGFDPCHNHQRTSQSHSLVSISA